MKKLSVQRTIRYVISIAVISFLSVFNSIGQGCTATITPDGPLTFCDGSSVGLEASINSTYIWSAPFGSPADGATTQSVTATMSGTYSVTTDDGSGCTATDQVVVTVNTPPSPSITPLGPVMACGGTAALDAGTGYTSYLWSNGATTQTINYTGGTNPWDNLGLSILGAGYFQILMPDGTTAYTTNGDFGLAPTGEIIYLPTGFKLMPSITIPQGYLNIFISWDGVVTVDMGPSGGGIVTVGQIQLANFANPAGLTAIGDDLYLESNASGFPVVSNPCSNGFGVIAHTYTASVVVTDANGCSGEASVKVTMLPTPTVPVVTPGGPTTFCTGDVTLEATTDFGCCDATGTYEWSNGETTQSITVSTSGNYYVTVTNMYGCTAVSAVTVVTAGVTVSISPMGPIIACGGAVTLDAGPGFTSYLWSNGAVTQTTVFTGSLYPWDNLNLSIFGAGYFMVTLGDGTTAYTTSGNFGLNAMGEIIYIPTGDKLNPGITIPADYLDIRISCDGIVEVLLAGSGWVTVGQIQLAVFANPMGLTDIGNGLYQESVDSGFPTVGNPCSDGFGVLVHNYTASVVVTDATGCTGEASVEVTMYPAPTTPVIMPSGPTEFCSGDVTLEASSDFGCCQLTGSYAWSNGETTQSITVSTSGTYTVTVTNAFGCTASSSIVVTGPPTPVINGGGVISVCGSSVILDAGAGYVSYQWSTGETTQSINFSGIYYPGGDIALTVGCAGYMIVRDEFGTTHYLTNGTLTTDISGNVIYSCGGSTYYLQYLPDGSSGPVTDLVLPAGTVSFTISPDGTVTVFDGVTYTVLGQIQLAMFANPIGLAYIGCNLYDVTVDSGAPVIGGPCTAGRGNLTTGYTVSVVVTDDNGCTGSASVSVTIYPEMPAPVITPDGPTTFCSGCVTLDAGNAGDFGCCPGTITYAWSNGETTQTIVVCESGTYTVTVTNGNGCTAVSAPVVVTGPSTVSITPSGGITLCGGSVTLDAGAGFADYVWSTGETTQSINFSGTYYPNSNITLSLTCQGYFIVKDEFGVQHYLSNGTLTVDGFGNVVYLCGGGTYFLQYIPDGTFGPIMDLVLPVGTVSFTIGSDGTVTVFDGTTYTVLGKIQVAIFVNPAGLASIGCNLYNETVESGTPIIGDPCTTSRGSIICHYTVSVVVTDDNGCTATSSVDITIYPPLPEPVITPDGPTTFCSGCVTLDAGDATAFGCCPGTISYLWSNGATTQTITVCASGTFTVTVSSGYGCTAASAPVVVTGPPTVAIGPAGPITLCGGGTVTLDAGAGYASYQWSTGEITQSIDFSGTYYPGSDIDLSVSCLGYFIVRDEFGANHYLTNGTLTVDGFGNVVYICGGNTYYLQYLPDGTFGPVTDLVLPVGTVSFTIGNDGTVTVFDGVTYTVLGQIQLAAFANPAGLASIGCNLYDATAESGTPVIGAPCAQGRGSVTTRFTVSVVVTDDNGCTGTASVTITIYPPLPEPVITPDGPTTACSGCVTLDAGEPSIYSCCPGIIRYEWSNGATTQTITVCESGDYTVTVSTVYGCTAVSAPVTVTIGNLSVSLTPSGPFTICSGGCVNIDAGPGYFGYLWSTGETTQSICFSGPTDPMDQLDLTILGLGYFMIQMPDGSIAYTTNGDFILNEFGQIVYEPTGYILLPGITIPVDAESISISCDGVVTCIIDGNVIVLGQIQLARFINPPGLVYIGDGLYQETPESGPPTQGNPCSDGFGILAHKYTVSVTVTDENGCTATASTTVTVYPAPATPVITPDGPLAFCTGGSVNLDAGTNYDCCNNGAFNGTYEWSNGETTQVINVTTPGTYSVTITNAYGCTAASEEVVVETGLTASAGTDVTICNGSSVVIGGSPTASNGSGSYTYEWSPADGLSATDVANPTANPTVTTVYTVNVTDGIGCTATGSVTVTVTDPPVAYAGEDVTICNGATTVLNGSGSGGSGDYSYAWTPETGLSPTNVSNPDASPGTTTEYTFIVTDNVTGCTASDNVVVTVTIVVADAGEDVTICGGSSVSIGGSPTGSGGTEPYTYAWSPADGLSPTDVSNPTAGPLTTTVYIVTVTDVNGCSGSASVTVTVAECCTAIENLVAGVDYTELQGTFGIYNGVDGYYYFVSSTQAWQGKYFVVPGTTVVIENSATLDLTNVDVIFGEGAGMLFADNSVVRSNNSVYRPCSVTGIWNGFTFIDNSSGIIDESLFKNALIGLHIQSAGDIRVDNNNFSNNDVAIFLEASDNVYNEAITGNTFLLNSNNPMHEAGVYHYYYGVKLYNTTVNGSVSQNDFIHQFNYTDSYLDFYFGVYAMYCSFSATKNNFTDMNRAFDVSYNTGPCTISNNSIENTINFQNIGGQLESILVWFCNEPTVIVEDNELMMNNDNSNSDLGIQIYMCNYVNVVGNKLSNFELYAIDIQYGDNINVLRNSIYDSRITGIMVATHGKCNVIGNYIKGNGGRINWNWSNGITVFDGTGPDVVVADNCIYNLPTALYIQSNSFTDNIPVIRNNFLYNYTYIGLFIYGYTGSVGTSCASDLTQLGSNTFQSNYLPPYGTAYDVYRMTSAFIDFYGNTPGTLVTFGNVNVYNCPHESIAACQYGSNNREDDGIAAGKYQPEDYIMPYFPVEVNGDEFSLKPDFMNAINSADNKLDYAVAFMNLLSHNSSFDELNTLYSQVRNAGILDAHQQQWLEYRYNLFVRNYTGAYATLSGISAVTTDEGDFINIEKMRLPYAYKELSVLTAPQLQLDYLNEVYTSNAQQSEYARRLLQLIVGKPDVQVVPHTMPILPDIAPATAVENDIDVYPNPTAGDLNVHYIVKNNDGLLRLTDVTGRLVQEYHVANSSGTIELDITDMTQGVYFLWLYSNDHFIKSVKIIKQ